MKSYKIVVIVVGIDQKYQSNILKGIQSTASECSFDFHIFASFSGIMDDVNHDKGELNIFKLPDFKNFDGAILLTNTIDYPEAAEDIIKRIKEAEIPAVCIDRDIAGLYHIGIDNKTAMRQITEHFIKVHGFTKFNYISGSADNSESADRLNAFLEVLEENGLTIDEKCIYYGDFRAPSGNAAIDYFIKETDCMPEAIICANDVMAAAAMNRLYEYGFKVPSEIAVSGFDNIFNSHNLRVELTSVRRPLKLSGQLAAKMLYNHFNNIEQERSVILNMSPIFTESCGCNEDVIQDYTEYKELNIRRCKRLDTISNYMTKFNQLSCLLHGCSTFEQFIVYLKEFTKEMNPEEFYFCLCDNWRSEFSENNEVFKFSDVMHKDYTDNIYVPIIYYHEKFYDVQTINKSTLIPDTGITKSTGKSYYYLPLHFGERCLGYMVIGNSAVSINNALFQSWCITVNNSLENIRKLICLNSAVERLEKLYTKDTFSGIYNRNGFVQATSDIFNTCVREERNIMLMFIDLDGLKVINDTYGHEIGDTAICSIADILCESCVNDEIFCRFGGDEFIVFAADYTKADALELTKRIEENIAKENSKQKHEFVLSASTGFIISVPKKDEDIFHFVTEADKKMYETKRKKKLSKYLKS